MASPLAVISGMAGMTGNEVARRLLARGWRVMGFDNFFSSSPASLEGLAGHAGFQFLEYNLNNTREMTALEELVVKSGRKARVVYINCAAVVHTKHFYEPSATFQTNVQGMKAWLDQAVRVGAETFINCSTSEVYSLKSFSEGGVKESDPLVIAGVETSQRASYAVGKLLTEFFLKEACDQGLIRGCSIRFANVYSHDELLPEHIIPYTIQTLRKGPCITLLENARATSRTFLHNHDSAEAVVRLIEAHAALDGTAYNVGTSEEINMVKLVEKIAALMEISALQITFSGHRTADPPRRLLNTAKLRKLTGWTPSVDLECGIRMCLGHVRQNVS